MVSGKRSTTRIFGWLALAAIVVVMFSWNFFFASRSGDQRDVLADNENVKTAVRSVTTVAVYRAAGSTDLVLPGVFQSVQETPIYARTDGYLKARLVDIGDRVQKGQLMAEIESPELDQQLLQAKATLEQANAAKSQALAGIAQAEANLAQAQANLELATVTLKRNQEMSVKGIVAKQNLDVSQKDFNATRAAVEASKAAVETARANAATADANIHANEANVQRLVELIGYRHVVAPFDGIVTSRNVEVGTLISSGSGSGNREIFRIGKSNTLRAFVNVPQGYAGSIHPGLQAEVSIQEKPGRVFAGKVERQSYALDSSAHTMVTVVDVNNPKLELLPGMYAQVKFVMKLSDPPLMIPADGLIFQADGTKVATVGSDQKIHYAKLLLGRDYGSEIEALSGLMDGAQVVINPPEDMAEGEPVAATLLKRK